MADAYAAMDRLEAGEKVNADEADDAGEPGRMVGHYWLRKPDMAPGELGDQIRITVRDIKHFTAHEGLDFNDVLVVGIGGSALGPQLITDALGNLTGRPDERHLHFLDNTDPDGMDRMLTGLRDRFDRTLVIVISKSGGTAETRNAMRETQLAFQNAGVDFASHAVAVTGEGSKLHTESAGWLETFPMWDWVGGRTSILSAVGLLPAELQGVDIDQLLAGAAAMDVHTRQHDTLKNPAALLALMWHHEVKTQGRPNMVILPYKDRLLLMSRYLQQLIMESLGKRLNTDQTKTVHEGITVYGNKGSTDQHAYVQQLRDGLNNFFANFIVVLQDTARPGKPAPLEVEDGVTPGDYLNGFWQGTRQALFDSGRDSVTITADKLDARTLGAFIALYERAVGFYATLVNINAYHQPGVEAGKKAAADVLDIQHKAVAHLKSQPGNAMDPAEIAQAIGEPDQAESIHHILEHLASNKRGIVRARGKFKANG